MQVGRNGKASSYDIPELTLLDKQNMACFCALQRHISIGEAQSQSIISLRSLVSKQRRAEEEPRLQLASLLYAEPLSAGTFAMIGEFRHHAWMTQDGAKHKQEELASFEADVHSRQQATQQHVQSIRSCPAHPAGAGSP